ncbi:MAG: glycosyltransferase family 2 protein [Bacteroidales bacterium]|nr:glycosyltransferase family 2 protein [Bacteroidales bacterium]
MAPLFSIITVTYNAEHTVGRTLDSVASQTCRLYEHIIVDGASTDSTLSIVEAAARPESRIVRSEPDTGLYDAMNKGMGMARGDYLIFLNAGDKFHSSDTLQTIADTIMNNDYPGIVYGQTDLVDDSGKYIGPRHLTAPDKLSYRDFARGMLVCHQAFVVLRRIATPYSLQWRFSADYEWCIRCLQHSRNNIPTNRVLIDYLAEGMTTANRRRSLIERFRIMSYYYGFWSTLWRHIGFVGRYRRHKKMLNNAHI